MGEIKYLSIIYLIFNILLIVDYSFARLLVHTVLKVDQSSGFVQRSSIHQVQAGYIGYDKGRCVLVLLYNSQ